MLNFKKVLGRGAFGVVRPYQKNDIDQKWAVKIIKAFTFEEVLQCFREITLGFSCDNPYILPVRGYLVEEDKNMGEWSVFIRLPRMQNGSLRDILNDHKMSKSLIPETKIAQYFYEMVCGLRYLHKKDIAHRDIKPENILFDENKTVKIADFGIGDLTGGHTSYAVAEKAGAVCYTAPENRDLNANLHQKDLFMADLWSLGIVLFELCTQLELKQLVLTSFGEKLEDTLKGKLEELEKEGKYSKALIELISSLLKWKPIERKSLKDVHEQLVNTYATQLQMNQHSREAQTEPIDFDQGLRARVQELEMHVEEIEKHYKGIIADLEKQLEQVQRNELESVNQTKPVKRRDDNKGENLKGRVLDLEFKLDAPQEIELFRKEIADVFEIQKGGNGIRIGRKKVTNQKIKELAAQFGTKLKSIEHININFECCPEISDESVKKLASQIGTNLKTLKSLTLSFESCESISDESMKKLAFHIGTNLKTLEHLDLNFSACKKLSDESLKALALHLQYNLQALQHLALNFSVCPGISDESVEELVLQVGTHLTTLQFFGLNFSSCREISDKSVKKIALQLIKFKALQTLTLAFSACPKISEKSVEELALQIVKINLKELILNFWNTGVCQHAKEEIKLKHKIEIF